MTRLFPLTLERRLDSRIWGGSSLAHWLDLSEAPAPLAEVWLVYEENQITAGPLAGLSLGEAVRRHGADLIGTTPMERYGAEFPLLAKFLDAAEPLSVQVHPNDEFAHSVEADSGFHGKTEAWHILQTKPDATVFHGFTHAMSREACEAALADGRLVELLRAVPAHVGETIFVPAGTIHAINGGVMLFEIQQKSDLTYRLYDYNRPRELQIERGLAVLDFNAPPTAVVAPQALGQGRSLLVRCDYFGLERWDLTAPMATSTSPTSFDILTIIDGTLSLDWGDARLDLRRGEAVVVPASLGAYRLITNAASMLRCYVP